MTSTNTVPVVSALRQPRTIVQANGSVITGVKSWEIEETNFHDPSTFRVCFAIGALPTANDVDWWSTQDDLTIEIFQGEPSDPTDYSSSDLTSIFTGRVDQLTPHWKAGELDISGRDLSSLLADVKSAAKYVNMTASAVATQLAGTAGLTPVVTSTSTKVGKYYQIDHVDLHDERTQWDVLTWLAREEQFVVYVKGKELHFEPAPSASQTPYLIQYTPGTDDGPAQGNFTDLSTTRELTLAKDIKVTVKSWNAKKKTGYSKSAGGGGSGAQEYSYTIAGLDPDQAQARATQILAELSKHEMKLRFEGPADETLAMTDVIQLSGTGTAFDQIYYPNTISRSFDAEEGFRWTVEAKNKSTTSEPAL